MMIRTMAAEPTPTPTFAPADRLVEEVEVGFGLVSIMTVGARDEEEVKDEEVLEEDWNEKTEDEVGVDMTLMDVSCARDEPAVTIAGLEVASDSGTEEGPLR